VGGDLRNPVQDREQGKVSLYLGAAMTCFMSYMLLPFLMMNGPEIADNHFVHTLRTKEARQGKPIEFDRVSYKTQTDHGTIRTFTNDDLQLIMDPLELSGTISLKGRFVDQSLIQVDEMHEHVPVFRDTASIIGLGLLALMWLYSFFIRNGTPRNVRRRSFRNGGKS